MLGSLTKRRQRFSSAPMLPLPCQHELPKMIDGYKLLIQWLFEINCLNKKRFRKQILLLIMQVLSEGNISLKC